jgi:CheY-like chemotaxis protein
MSAHVIDEVKTKPTLVLVGEPVPDALRLLQELKPQFELVIAQDMQEAMQLTDKLKDVRILQFHLQTSTPAQLLFWPKILEHYPDGVAVVDSQNRILWHNLKFLQAIRPAIQAQAGVMCDLGESNGETRSGVTAINSQQSATVQTSSQLAGIDLGTLLPKDKYLDQAHCPLTENATPKTAASAIINLSEKHYYDLEVIPIGSNEISSEAKQKDAVSRIVFLRDCSTTILQQQKIDAIYSAVFDFGDFTAEELNELAVDDRIDLLKSKIMHHTEHTLEYKTIEIRLLEHDSRRLVPLLAWGMDKDAEVRELYSEVEGNGVTGYVAATGKSYLCPDTLSDRHYLPGAPGAMSSITVPLVLHDEVLGTLNVESSQVGTFTDRDKRFLELFGREVAMALNTLNLLAAQQASTASESCSLLLREVAAPVDEILNDTFWILEKYLGHEPEVAERLQKILKHTREIRSQVHKVEDKIAPDSNSSLNKKKTEHPQLDNKLVLVADADLAIRRAAHELLNRYGCQVETAHDGEEALRMSRRTNYDLVIVDIRLPDMSGSQCYTRLKKQNAYLPVILMTGFGYDPGHSIVRARQMGLKSVLYKPFRLDQLIGAVENCILRPQEYSPPPPPDEQILPLP